MKRGYVAKSLMLLGLNAFATLSLIMASDKADAGQKALLIGVGQYPHSQKSNLKGPPKDIKNMTEFLKNQWGFRREDIGILKDAKATKSAIMHALNVWLPKKTKPGDRVVIYYSGHGGQTKDRNGDEADGKDEFVTTADIGKGGRRHVNQLVLDDEFATAMRKLSNREVIFISDSCHSGTITRNFTMAEDTEPDVKPRYLPFDEGEEQGAMPLVGRDEEPLSRDIQAHLTISAAMPHQFSWDTPFGGVFTRLMIEALSQNRADANKNGRITSSELLNYIKPRTESWCQKREKCRPVRFTPNIDPKDQAFVMTPFAQGALQTVQGDSNQDISDILPPLQQDALSVRIKPGAQHRLGDEVSFEIKAKFAGYLTLLDLNAANEMVLLFPTKDDIANGKSGKIRANAPLRVPDASYGFAFEAGLPTGKGQLLAIVTQDKIDFDALLKDNRDFEPIKDRSKLAKKISEKLYAVWTGNPDHNRAVRWAVGYTDYAITE